MGAGGPGLGEAKGVAPQAPKASLGPPRPGYREEGTPRPAGQEGHWTLTLKGAQGPEAVGPLEHLRNATFRPTPLWDQSLHLNPVPGD